MFKNCIQYCTLYKNKNRYFVVHYLYCSIKPVNQTLYKEQRWLSVKVRQHGLLSVWTSAGVERKSANHVSWFCTTSVWGRRRNTRCSLPCIRPSPPQPPPKICIALPCPWPRLTTWTPPWRRQVPAWRLVGWPESCVGWGGRWGGWWLLHCGNGGRKVLAVCSGLGRERRRRSGKLRYQLSSIFKLPFPPSFDSAQLTGVHIISICSIFSPFRGLDHLRCSPVQCPHLGWVSPGQICSR